MPTLVHYSEWTPQEIKMAFCDRILIRSTQISDEHIKKTVYDDEIDSTNWHLDPSHPLNHPGAQLIRSRV